MPHREQDAEMEPQMEIAMLREQVRLLKDIALSACALKINIEHGATQPPLHALKRDLAAYAARFSRPANYAQLTAQEQWEVDERLGIHDLGL